jgi:phage terminase large subunit
MPFLQQMEMEILNCFGIEAVLFSPLKFQLLFGGCDTKRKTKRVACWMIDIWLPDIGEI